MPHGLPDWGMYGVAKTIHRLADMGELAARLGSITTFDRRGEAVFLDDFEGDLKKWLNGGNGLDNAIAISSDYARSGGLSLKITTGRNLAQRGGMRHYEPYLVAGQIGFEISFTYQVNLTVLSWQMVVADGAFRRECRVKLTGATGVLQYLDADGVDQDFGTITALPDIAGLFHTGKLVVDMENRRYMRFLIDDHAFDLSAYPLRYRPLVEDRRTFMIFETFTATGANQDNYVDDAIFTQNEP